MQKFFKIVLTFLIPILVVGVTMEVLLQRIPNSYKIKTAYYNNHRNTIKTLILGSSHLEYGINPEFLSTKALNFANVSQTLDVDYQLLRGLAPKMPNLKYVIVRLSYATLFEQLETGEENWRVKDYNLYTPKQIDYKIKHQSEIFSVKFNINVNRILDYYVYNSHNLKTLKTGYTPNPALNSSIKLNELGKAIAIKHTIKDKSLYQENVAYLKQIVEFCNERNLSILLVTTPTHHSYYLNLDNQQLQSTTTIGEYMAEEYNNCRYYNLLKHRMFNKSDFFDGDHLNTKGAKKLTKFLNDKIESL